MDFLNLAFTFPTVLYTTLLLVVILFWVITLLGFADIDMFEADVELEAETNDGAGQSQLLQMGFGGLPITVSLTLVIMLSWLASIYIHQFFAYLLGDGVTFYLVGMAMLIVSFIVGVPLAALFSQPLHRFFESKEILNKNDMIGLECVIATSKVTDSFGQAKVQLQGTEQLIEVRTDSNEPFSLGDTAVLIEHISQKRSFIIAKQPW